MHHLFKSVLVAAALLFGGASLSHGQPVAAGDHEQDHVQLRALRDAVTAAISSGDIDGIVATLHPNVVITWQNGEVCKGREQVRSFYQKMAAQPKKTFQGYKLPPTADEPTILYSGATSGVVYGRNVGRFYLAGKEIEMPNRWTATVVKENGQWLIASYHVSMNVLDNPLLNGIKKTASIGFVVALVIGGLVGWLLGKKRANGRA